MSGADDSDDPPQSTGAASSSTTTAEETGLGDEDSGLDTDGDTDTGGTDDETDGWPNLEGHHNPRIDDDCTIYVSPSGNDQQSGASLEEALRTAEAATALAEPGDIVCFDAGTYTSIVLDNFEGDPEHPLVFRTIPGREREAIFTSGTIDSGYGVRIRYSSYIHVYDLRFDTVFKGFDFHSSHHGRFEGLVIENVGQEAFSIGRERAYPQVKFLGPETHHVDVLFNDIRDTGLRVDSEGNRTLFGEGIYIGTGAPALMGQDTTHDIFIAYNTLQRIYAEGIELKPGSYNHIVRGNTIIDSSHEFNGAITACVEDLDLPDGNYLIEDNRIYNYSSRNHLISGIAIGHGNAIIRNNVIWGIEEGRGIRTYRGFGNQEAANVEISNNTIYTPGSGDSIALDNSGSGNPGNYDVFDNLTDDGSEASAVAAPTMFDGPIDGYADMGDGIGSGFRQVEYAGIGADLAPILGE